MSGGDAATDAFDLVLFGATSFVGRLVAARLVERHGTGGPLRWAIAGRDAGRLERIARESGAAVPRLVVDAHDPVSLGAMCARTRLVISTVGPYALHGSALVAAVVEAGIDSVDLTGEPQWMRRTIDAHHDRAVGTGARVVHACGFDSVPSDLGVRFLQDRAVERFGEPCTRVRMGVKAAKGGFSGGTIASLMNVLAEASGDAAERAVLADPYALAPPGDRAGVPQPKPGRVAHDPGLGGWTAPFVMAPTNTRVVFRTHALLGHPWGPDFTYGEAVMTGEGARGRAKAFAVAGAFGGFTGVASLGPVRRALARVLPKSGEGPDEAAREAGFYDLRFHGTTASGESIATRVTGDRDPGYGSTSKILVEAATALLDSDAGGGVLTPATALGAPFLDALEAHAGLAFEVL